MAKAEEALEKSQKVRETKEHGKRVRVGRENLERSSSSRYRRAKKKCICIERPGSKGLRIISKKLKLSIPIKPHATTDTDTDVSVSAKQENIDRFWFQVC